MRNIISIIAAHNREILNPKTKLNYGCNCRMEENCPLDNKCLTPGVVYEAKIKADGNNNDGEMRYIGLANGTFKQRYANHCRDFKYSKYRAQNYQNIFGN